MVALEDGENPQRAVDRLDHRRLLPSRRYPGPERKPLVLPRNISVPSDHHSTCRMIFGNFTALSHSTAAVDVPRRTHVRTVHTLRSSPPRSSAPRSSCSSGVGSVPATLIVNGDAPFTMADLGMISLAFGTIVVATVYALGHVCGNHINPAVTLGFAVTGKFPWREVPGYIGAQVVGAVIGAAAIIAVLGHKASEVGPRRGAYGPGVSVGQAFTAEFVGTFILVFTIFGVIHRKAPPGFAGVAIGLVVFAAIIPVAPATGASINPARTFGPMIVQQIAGGAVKWEQLPVYLIAELLAGAARGDRVHARSRPILTTRPRPSTDAPGIPAQAADTPAGHLTTAPVQTWGATMKKLINDPADCRHRRPARHRRRAPGTAGGPSRTRSSTAGTPPCTGKVGHHLRRRLRARAAARRVRRRRHARRRLRRRSLHLTGARPDARGDQERRRRGRGAAHREELHRRRHELRDGGRDGRRRDRRRGGRGGHRRTTSPSRTACTRPADAASASPCSWRRSPAPPRSRAQPRRGGRRRPAASAPTAAAWAWP